MQITKVAQCLETCYRPSRSFESARNGFKAFLRAVCREPGDRVLLPAYVGWSAREGSGVFDPVRELGLAHGFYQVDGRLHIDLGHLEERLREGGVKVVTLIHYFGYVDPGYVEAVNLARRYGAWIMEDEAHAMLTDLIGGASGRLGDACIFSLHKMLPLPKGGLLVANPDRAVLLEGIDSEDPGLPSPWEFDLFEISRRRRENARLWTELLRPLEGEVDPLWGNPSPGEVPQTYPVLVRNVSRDALYERMNGVGFGAVSLYHTMIDSLRADEYPASHELSRRIFNLPVHQDAAPEAIRAMADRLAREVHAMRSLSGSAAGTDG